MHTVPAPAATIPAMSSPRFFSPLACLLLALPWLTPFAPGPSPAVVPWLVALMCTATLLGLSALRDRAGSPVRESLAAHWAAPFAWALLLAGAFSVVMGLLQYFGLAAAFEPWIKQGTPGEAFANLRQRNQFATLTNLALAAALWLAARSAPPSLRLAPAAANAANATNAINAANAAADWSGETSAASASLGSRTHWRWRGAGALWPAAAVLLAAGNVASSSRTGLLQLVLLLALYAVWGGWRHAGQRRVLLAAAIGYAVFLFALPYLAGFDLGERGMFARLREAPACGSRLVLWTNVLQLIGLRPWLGWGWGELDFAHYMTLYSGPRFCEILDNAHNLPLHLAFTWGVPAALLGCGLAAWWVVVRSPWRESDASRQLAWAGLALIGLHSLVEYPLWYGPFQIAAGLCIGLLWRRKYTDTSGILEPDRPLGHTIRAPVAIILIATAGYALWDYHRISQIYLPPEARAANYRFDASAQARRSWLFRDQVDFAELTTTPVTRENAKTTFIKADRMLHYSPEPRVIEKAIESAVMLGLDDDALAHLSRFRAAFPADHAAWVRANEQAGERRAGDKPAEQRTTR
ncbi:MAG: Wzy polymerase domain-containing protein [Polaromonas sp.]|nr:Wzy polymerase domain-containing protein [Polaromonas sp.]